MFRYVWEPNFLKISIRIFQLSSNSSHKTWGRPPDWTVPFRYIMKRPEDHCYIFIRRFTMKIEFTNRTKKYINIFPFLQRDNLITCIMRHDAHAHTHTPYALHTLHTQEEWIQKKNNNTRSNIKRNNEHSLRLSICIWKNCFEKPRRMTRRKNKNIANQ